MILWVLFYPQLTFSFSPYPTPISLHVPVLWVQSFPPADFSSPPTLCLFLHNVHLWSMILWVLFYPQLTFSFSPEPTLNSLHVPVLWVQSFPPADFSLLLTLCLFFHNVFLSSMILWVLFYPQLTFSFSPYPTLNALHVPVLLSSIISSCRLFTSSCTLSLSSQCPSLKYDSMSSIPNSYSVSAHIQP